MSSILDNTDLFDLFILEVASPQAYGLVGMAAALAGVCQVPLTSVLLLFELTQDYRIVLPLLGTVGLSTWIASSQSRRSDPNLKMDPLETKVHNTRTPTDSLVEDQYLAGYSSSIQASQAAGLCNIEGSLCLYESDTSNFKEKLTVSHAMHTTNVSVLMSVSLIQAVDLMLMKKQSCAMIVTDDNVL